MRIKLSLFSGLRRAALLAVAIGSLAGSAAADDRTEVRSTVESFYKGYPKADDPEKLLMKSPAVSRGLRKSYTAFMKKDLR